MNASVISSRREPAVSSPAMIAEARDRAALIALLADLFRREPDQQMLASLRKAELREALSQAGMALEDSFFNDDIDALAEMLAVEYARLFLLPGTMISPHESVQIKRGSGLLRGPETARVREYYEYVGFEMEEILPMEADHISIELEFLSHLATEEANAWESGEHKKALDALRYQDDFLRRHLGQWGFDFLDRVEAAAGSGFYYELARLTAAFLKEQREQLPQMIAQLQSEQTGS
ncbi:MAG TPA: hypothetical protein ENI98_05740 [Gammaproteobacteria bacterium]|nr:hypothetical protein [Gammaproteobacteria bacterium]